jgi:hypothetical protein
MAKWDKKYFVTDLVNTNMVEAAWNPRFTDKEGTRLIALDSNIRPGAFYMETAWFWPGKWPATKGDEGTIKAHSHPFDEVIAFVGSNKDDLMIWAEKSILGKLWQVSGSVCGFPLANDARSIRCELDKPVFILRRDGEEL